MKPCAWSYNHPGENVLATNKLTAPGAVDGGTDWFGGPEPPIILDLCDTCTAVFVEQNGGPEIVRVEALSLPVPEGSLFSPPRRETHSF